MTETERIAAVIDAIIVDWPVYLVAAILWTLCLLAVRIGVQAIAIQCKKRRLAIDAEAMRREVMRAERFNAAQLDRRD